MPDKMDYKKEYRDLYMPKAKPMEIQVPAMSFIMVDGTGTPDGAVYQNSVSALYALSFGIKMSKMGGNQPEGYFEYVVPPLEGLWWGEGGFDLNDRNSWFWTSMIRQPEFVTEEFFQKILAECRVKKPEIDFSKVRLETFEEGLCVQCMHIGPYSTEQGTIDRLHQYISENGLKNMTGMVRKHHEIYLSDPRKAAPDKQKTVLRLPVERLG